MTISVVLLCIAIGVIVCLKRKMASMKKQHQEDLSAERKRVIEATEEAQRYAEQQIKEFKARMEAERKDLERKDEKTLIIDMLLGLSRLGNRMRGLEETVDLVATKQSSYYNATADVIASTARAAYETRENIRSMRDSGLDYFEVRDIREKLDRLERKLDDI